MNTSKQEIAVLALKSRLSRATRFCFRTLMEAA